MLKEMKKKFANLEKRHAKTKGISKLVIDGKEFFKVIRFFKKK
jgi:hypothetical protein